MKENVYNVYNWLIKTIHIYSYNIYIHTHTYSYKQYKKYLGNQIEEFSKNFNRLIKEKGAKMSNKYLKRWLKPIIR